MCVYKYLGMDVCARARARTHGYVYVEVWYQLQVLFTLSFEVGSPSGLESTN